MFTLALGNLTTQPHARFAFFPNNTRLTLKVYSKSSFVYRWIFRTAAFNSSKSNNDGKQRRWDDDSSDNRILSIYSGREKLRKAALPIKIQDKLSCFDPLEISLNLKKVETAEELLKMVSMVDTKITCSWIGCQGSMGEKTKMGSHQSMNTQNCIWIGDIGMYSIK